MGDRRNARLETVLAHYRQEWPAGIGGPGGVVLGSRLIAQQKAFDKALKRCGLEELYNSPDVMHPDGTRYSPRALAMQTLARLLAEAQFGESKGGGGRQVREWSLRKIHSLAAAYALFRLAVPFSEVRDAQYAKQLAEKRPHEFGKDPEAIRQRLPGVKRMIKAHCDPETCENPGRGLRICKRCLSEYLVEDEEFFHRNRSSESL
jgi:hypothetical protein